MTLRQLRRTRFTSQRALAARARVNVSTVVDLEAGRGASVKISTLEQIAEALGKIPLTLVVEAWQASRQSSMKPAPAHRRRRPAAPPVADPARLG